MAAIGGQRMPALNALNAAIAFTAFAYRGLVRFHSEYRILLSWYFPFEVLLMLFAFIFDGQMVTECVVTIQSETMTVQKVLNLKVTTIRHT